MSNEKTNETKNEGCCGSKPQASTQCGTQPKEPQQPQQQKPIEAKDKKGECCCC